MNNNRNGVNRNANNRSNVRPQNRGNMNNNGYTRRRPQTKKKSNDGMLWLMIFVIGIAIFGAIVFLMGYLKDDGNVTPVDTTGSAIQTSAQTDNQSGTQEGNGNGTTAVQTTSKPAETEPPKEIEYVPEFTADLSAYEMYMNPQGADRDAYLILVNPDNPLTEDDVPNDLVAVQSTRKDGRATQKLREYAAKALEALMLEANACGVIKKNTPSGYPLSVMSAYRSYSYQNQLFTQYVNQEMNSKGYTRAQAEAVVVTYSCRPGTSEHQSGLCVDMHTLSSAGQAFKNEAEAKWLAENSYKFGFVLRFPEDKQDVTKIIYEPWHFRYVGRYHAKKMYDLKMCLEEYTEYLKNN